MKKAVKVVETRLKRNQDAVERGVISSFLEFPAELDHAGRRISGVDARLFAARRAAILSRRLPLASPLSIAPKQQSTFIGSGAMSDGWPAETKRCFEAY